MCNEILKALIIDFKKGYSKSFYLIHKVFERLIKLYASRIYYEDGESELNLFLIELLYKLDLSRFDSLDSSFTIQKYIAVALRNKYLDVLKKSIELNQKTLPLLEQKADEEEHFYEKLMLPNAFSLLTVKQQEVLIRKYIYGYKDTEISETMGISRQAVNGIKNRAIEILKNYYQK